MSHHEAELRKEVSSMDLKSNRMQKKESTANLQNIVKPPVVLTQEEKREFEKHAKKELEHLKLVLTTHEKLHALLKLGVTSANTIGQLLIALEEGDTSQSTTYLLFIYIRNCSLSSILFIFFQSIVV
jgi:hypothetical protein